MRIIKINTNKVCIAKDLLYSDYLSKSKPTRRLEQQVERWIDVFTRKIFYKDFLKLYSKASALEGYAILRAHARSNNSSWHYYEKGKAIGSIQSWINNVDGDYLALIFPCCNPRNEDVHSKKSILIYPKKEYSEAKALVVGYKMFVPNHGCVNYHKLKRLIDGLEA